MNEEDLYGEEYKAQMELLRYGICYDERLPFPVVNYEIARPFIVYAKERGGQYYFCECARTALMNYREMPNPLSLEEAHLNPVFAPCLCFKCNERVSRVRYTSPMYGSVFKQRWGWYIDQKAYENGHLHPTAEDENELRLSMGFKKKGKQWENEALMFYILKKVFENRTVIQHYRPEWLKGLELDVWVEEERLAFEYQGIQHYKAVEHWGGESALEQRKKKDAQKVSLCKKNGVRLIKIRNTEDITEELIRDKIKKSRPSAANNKEVSP